MSSIIGIYKITNIINNKCYIGQSVSITKRFESHRSKAFDPLDHCYEYPLYRAIRKYGLENFKFEILEECSEQKLNEREIYWINYYKSNQKEYGYNQTLTEYNDHRHFSKLNQQSLDEIRNKLLNTDILIKDIAKQYGVSENAITAINTGYCWRDDEHFTYPLRPQKRSEPNYCVDCGKPIFRTSTRCPECERKRRIVPLDQMPVTRAELKQLIRTTPFTTIASQYGITDNAVRRWCDKFNLPRKKAEINKISDEEWELV